TKSAMRDSARQASFRRVTFARPSPTSWSGCVSIAEAKQTPFKFEPAVRESYQPDRPVLSVIIDCYYGLDLVKQSVQSVLDQDYPNVELLLVNNGAQPDVAEFIRE